MNSRQSWNIITLFLLLVFGFAAATIIKPKRAYSERENRTLAQMPAPTADSIFSGQFEEDYEAYLTDQFILRDSWIALKTKVQRLLLNQDINDVYFAKHDYLIEKHTGVFESELAEKNKANLDAFVDKYLPVFSKEHLSVILVPNALEVLKDYLPAFAAPYDEESYLMQIRSILPEGVWTDALAVLNSHNQEYLFYRTDHHWTTYASWLVLKRWIADKEVENADPDDVSVRQITDEFEGTIASKIGTRVKPDVIECYEPSDMPSVQVRINNSDNIVSSLYDESKLEGRDKYAYFLGGNYAQIQIRTSVKNGKKLLMIKDSYAHCMVPMLTELFEEIDLVDVRYFNQSLSAYIEEQQFTDLIFLYNAAGFAEDASLSKLLA